MRSNSAVAWAGSALLLILAVTPVHGQEAGTISTGRPGFATGAGIVPGLQLEAGYQVTTGVGANDYEFGQVLVRLPLMRRAELRLGLGSLALSGPTGSRETGFRDIRVGTKIRIAAADESNPLRPAAAMIVATSLPTGSDGFGATAAQPGANLILSWHPAPGLELLSNTLATSRSTAGGRTAEYSQAAYLGLDVPGPATLFVETYTIVGEGRVPAASVGAGLTWALNRDFQFDVHGGIGLSSVAPDRYFGVGVGRRW